MGVYLGCAYVFGKELLFKSSSQGQCDNVKHLKAIYPKKAFVKGNFRKKTPKKFQTKTIRFSKPRHHIFTHRKIQAPVRYSQDNSPQKTVEDFFFVQ